MESTLNVTNNSAKLEETHKNEIFGIINGIVCVMAVLGNLIILVTFMKNKKLRYFGNYFLMSLSVSDFINGIFQAGKAI